MGNEKKCIVWDLDNTLWEGTLLESKKVRLKEGIESILQSLDSRGILHSIASKNNHEDAMEKLREFGLEEYFLYPEIHWNAKSSSISSIRQSLNIGIDSIVFIDDQEFEREEVRNVHPDVLCLDAREYLGLLDRPYLNPKFVTVDSGRRRAMYLESIQRDMAEKEYEGPQDDFLASLNMKFVIKDAQEEDLQRAEELTVRTNQLNATGKTFSYDQLKQFSEDSDYKLLICELTDKFGSYGKIGLALIHLGDSFWKLKLLLMSCRVISRGVGTVLLTHIMKEAKKNGKGLRADFRDTGRNRMMNISFRLNGFHEVESDGKGNYILENSLDDIQEFPSYIELKH